MENEEKIFHSNITRVDFEKKNDLYDLLNVTPAKPIPVETSKNETCMFKPRCDQYYVPKIKSSMKVRTVREIRNLFELENYSLIIEDMEKQQIALLTKIRTGSSTDESTKKMAKQLLTADHPISRTAWQMLNNINPDKNVNPTQFVLWNGRRIRIVGSRGGKNKFICNHDLGKDNIEEIKKKSCSEKYIKKKHGLLRNSLNIKFKPGPLRRKKNLDDSHQKYHMGPVELVKLPKPALDIQPAYGIVAEPIMSCFLNQLRAEDGFISEKWAEFAVSVLGTVQNNSIVQVNKECCVTFNLSYKCDQDRILMRRDIGRVSTNSDNVISQKYTLQKESDNISEIKDIFNKILDSVEISLKQDCVYSIENKSPETEPEPYLEVNTNGVKEKHKKKYGELDRLAVTVIQLPGTPKENSSKPCGKSYCSLGCLCDSLNCTYKFKQHCGNLECMFGCKCELSKYKDIELLENDDCAELIPGLINLDHEINANLAKEEQKFHQTVVVSGEKSILLKSRKRTSKSTMKYAEFYSNLRLKNEQGPKKILTIVGEKLNCANIEPWCMVHNLYKCFCKGRFTETLAFNTAVAITNTTADLENSNLSDHDDVQIHHDNRNVLRPRVRQSRESSNRNKRICILDNEYNLLRNYVRDDPSNTSARTNGYLGRKYDDSYYETTNLKIKAMEKNDTRLFRKIIRIIKNTESSTISADLTPVILSNTRNSEDTTLGKGKKVKRKKENLKNCDNNTNPKKLATDKIDSELHKNNSAHNAEPSTKLSKILDSPSSSKTLEADEDSKTLEADEDSETSTVPKIPFEISGDIYKPINGHQITQEFLTPWIAKSYKNYKEQLNNGKSTLERPKKGRIILHLWECLLSRYRSRRNVFLTTTKRPFRIYIATETWTPFFKDCINIDAIRFADLHKYPCLVKKLLTNASNKDYFCILGGWDDCWEIIGSVKKNESVSDDPPIDPDLINTGSLSPDLEFSEENWCIKEDRDKLANNPIVDCSPKQEDNKTEIGKNSLERSKWFLMKLENDFTEIYCHKKGFYVERDKIVHAINLARATRKTVVINKQNCTEITNIPFGIYALPDTTEYCAVVGPYEIYETLGLEIVKSSVFTKQPSTKGYWITTNKVDNIKVLDDPMSFLPKPVQSNLCNTTAVNTPNDTDYIQPSTSQERSIKTVQKTICINTDIIKKNIPKIVKPIKIRRTNGFYHLTSNNNIVKKISPNTGRSLLDVKCLGIKPQNLINDPKSFCYSNAKIMNSEEINGCNEPNGADQLKIISVYSENDNTNDTKKKEDKKSGMFVLKPEEINKKVSNCNNRMTHLNNENETNEMGMDIDIENFLTSEGLCRSIENDVLLISDEEDDVDNASKDTQKWTDVVIQCSTIDNLGWIRGRRNEDNLLSIDFPGFMPMNSYTEDEAFDKINK